MKNISRAALEAAKKLVATYRELATKGKYPKRGMLVSYLADKVGFAERCTICEAVEGNCCRCIYPDTVCLKTIGLPCLHKDSKETYHAISDHKGSLNWSSLINNRADYLESRIRRIESGDLKEYLEDN